MFPKRRLESLQCTMSRRAEIRNLNPAAQTRLSSACHRAWPDSRFHSRATDLSGSPLPRISAATDAKWHKTEMLHLWLTTNLSSECLDVSNPSWLALLGISLLYQKSCLSFEPRAFGTKVRKLLGEKPTLDKSVRPRSPLEPRSRFLPHWIFLPIAIPYVWN